MSRQNKVNPGQYSQAGRLSPDDLGRERQLQSAAAAPARVPKAKRPAWETTPPSSKTADANRGDAPGRVKVPATRSGAATAKTASARARKTPARARRTAKRAKS